MPEAKILVVDDEPNILKLVTAYMRQEGFEIYEAQDGNAALKAFKAFKPDIVILDVMLPGVDGLDVLSRIRRESDAYVILLTARTAETDRVVGLTVGADDYVTKPFSPRELVARVKAALRRLRLGDSPAGADVITYPRLCIDSGSRKVWLDEQLMDLTTIEFDLLKTMAEYNEKVLSREQLLEKVWGYDYYGDTRVVDVHVGHIRRKLGTEFIETVRGIGYRFDGGSE